jgi:hypothetical protein
VGVSLLPASERRFLGIVEVDSGTLVIGDPAYLLARRSAGKRGVDYEEVLGVDTADFATRLGDRPVLLVSGFGGDGTFPVFGEFEEGELARVTIEFDEPDDKGL